MSFTQSRKHRHSVPLHHCLSPLIYFPHLKAEPQASLAAPHLHLKISLHPLLLIPHSVHFRLYRHHPTTSEYSLWPWHLASGLKLASLWLTPPVSLSNAQLPTSTASSVSKLSILPDSHRKATFHTLQYWIPIDQCLWDMVFILRSRWCLALVEMCLTRRLNPPFACTKPYRSHLAPRSGILLSLLQPTKSLCQRTSWMNWSQSRNTT